jgi:hypothetical protein
MLIVVHMIWLVYVEIMILEIIVVFCITFPLCLFLWSSTHLDIFLFFLRL